MKRSSYGERDYAFGQMILNLRTHIGLTQAGMAELLHVSRRAVAEWEAGSTYPKAEHLKQLIALGVQQQAFPAGREAEEIRALWHAAHQKLLFDEPWLAALLGRPRPALTLLPSVSLEEPKRGVVPVAEPTPERRVDWSEALAVPSFYGRKSEVAMLSEWVVAERCRVVSVMGLGGIGKSSLVVSLMHQVAPHFEVVLWRSLRDAPSCEELLEDCLQVFALQPLADVPTSLDGRLGLLLGYLRETRALLVLDNLETLLEEGAGTGRMRDGYEGYAQLLRRVAETSHQSCLLITSREKPGELVPLEGSHTPVRSLRLEGLERDAVEQLLEERELVGSEPDRERLIEAYGGNPLALKIVAETIVELFGGEIAEFLAGGELVFGSVRELLDEQFARLSAVEQTVLLWLAILREPVSIEELLSMLGAPLPRVQVLEAVEALRRRSLIEQGHRRGSFTLQSVVLEYATARLIEEAASEIEQGRLERLIEQRLALAGVKEYVWQTQQRLIVTPLLTQLRQMYQGRDEVEERLLALLDQLRERADYAQGYGPANLISLLRVQRGHLRGLDLSHLVIRGAYLQGVEMQDTTLAGSTIQDSVLTETFDAITAVAVSPNGRYWAAGSRRGEARVWVEQGQILHWIWQAHADNVIALAFSPDGRMLATGSWDCAVKLWDVERGTLLWTGWHTDSINSVTFAPDGRTFASGGDDGTVRLWDVQRGTLLQTLSNHGGPVYAVALSPDGSLIASAGFDSQIRLWEMQEAQPGTSVRLLTGHTNWVTTLAFAPDGRTLASASWDRTVKLWDVESGDMRETLSGHSDPVFNLAWSPDGRLLASCGVDHSIWLWDVERVSYRIVLRGHTDVVSDIVFTPDSLSLLSGSEDCTMRVWDVEQGQCARIMQSYAVSLYDLTWSPDGKNIASAGSDTLVTIWDVEGGTPSRLLVGHSWIVNGVAWSPDGRLLASCGWDAAVRVWDASTAACVQILRDPNHDDTPFQGIAWSPGGQWLVNGSFQRGVQVWEVTTGSRRWVSRGQPTRIRRVAWSPGGTHLASGGDDGSVCLWQASDGTQSASLQGHRGKVMSVAWSQDGARLASGGGRVSGELFVWEVQSGERLYTLNEPSAMVNALVWSSNGAVLVSGGSDGMLRWWDLQHGECVRVCKAHQGAIQSLNPSPDGQRLASCGDDGAIQVCDITSGEHLRSLRRDRPYERLNITGVRGLTEAQRGSLLALGAIEEATTSLTQER
jgi:WD40 repeat protein/transcriptional regulator with XRE-family HTH domain